MTLTFSDTPAVTRDLWRSPNGRWVLRRVFHGKQRWHDLAMKPKPTINNPYPDAEYSFLFWSDDGEVIMDPCRPLPAYVIDAIKTHLPR